MAPKPTPKPASKASSVINEVKETLPPQATDVLPAAPESTFVPDAAPEPAIKETVVADPTQLEVTAPVVEQGIHPTGGNRINQEFVDADKTMHTCRIIDDVDAVIGRQRYKLKKGQVTKLPGTVFEVLKNANKAW